MVAILNSWGINFSSFLKNTNYTQWCYGQSFPRIRKSIIKPIPKPTGTGGTRWSVWI
jgi:hypothetical protein